MAAPQSNRLNFIAVLVAMSAALIARAWLQLELLEHGAPRDFAADLSYLLVPPLLLVLLFPVWRQEYPRILSLFKREDLRLRLILNAVAVGCLLRLASWSQLVASVSFGWNLNTDPNAIVGPVFSFRCPEPQTMALGILVMVILVPLVEEIVNRGLIQSWLAHRGALFSIGVSALIFMLPHRPSSWLFAFCAGLVVGIQFWRTRSLWCSLITHSTINGLIQVDWRCLNGQWNPPAAELPKWAAGLGSMTILLLTILTLGLLLKKTPGSNALPGNEKITERLQPSR